MKVNDSSEILHSIGIYPNEYNHQYWFNTRFYLKNLLPDNWKQPKLERDVNCVRRGSRNQKGAFPSSQNSVSAGGLGGTVSPPVGPGQSPRGSSPDFEFFYPKNTLKIVF